MSIYDPDYSSNFEARKKQNKITGFVIIIIIGIAGAVLFSKYKWGIFSFQTDLAQNWNDIFLKYFFIIVAIERAAAVYVGISRNENKRKWERRIRRVREILEMERSKTPTAAQDNVSVDELYKIYEREEQIISDFEGQKGFLGITKPKLEMGKEAPVNNVSNKNALLAYLQATKNVYEFKSVLYQEKTNMILMKTVFFGGIIISTIGLSIFGDIFKVGEISTTQDFFYRLSDIVVTGGLIGGGSKSFNVFIETLNKTLERVKDPKGTD